MKISQLDMLTACWHTAQHNSDYSKSNIGKIEHELAKYIQNNHNLPVGWIKKLVKWQMKGCAYFWFLVT